jgi:hypothetical protein
VTFPPPQRARLPFDAAGTFRRAVEFHRSGQLAQAEALYRELLRFQPRHRETLHNLGMIGLQKGDPRGALPYLRKALKADPRNPQAHLNLGAALQRLGQAEDALATFTRAASLRPEYPEAWLNLGHVLGKLGRFAESLAAYDRALGRRADYPEALDGRGNALTDLGRPAEALAAYDRALELQPDYVEALVNRAFVLTDLNRYAEALADLDRALALRPGFGRAHFDASMALLVSGDFKRGWQEFEWRWRVEGGEQDSRGFRQPQWRGEEDIAGRTILLHAEQGLGDSIEFCRYAPLVAARGARVIVEVQRPLTGLLAQLPGVSQVIARGEALPPFDLHCPLLSLPLAFRTDAASIPAPRSYLAADPARIAHWQAKLGTANLPCIGLAWSGSPGHRNDRNRSIPLETLARLCDAGWRFVGLQKDVREADRAALRAQPAIMNLGEELADFNDTAALLACLDLVVCVDTAVAHLAGALGTPVWILLPFAPDWRWLLEREDSPWYPTARLFRQPAPGDWDSVLGRVATELKEDVPQRLPKRL